MAERLRRALPAVVGLLLFLAALEVLRIQLHALTWRALNADVWNTPPRRLGLALLLTILNYLVLTTYDFIAFSYIGKRLDSKRILVTSFVAYAVANNVGFSILSGASVRYRFYTRWGVSATDLSRVVFSYVVTFWLGLLLLGGLSLVRSPLPATVHLPFAATVIPLVGIVSAAASVAYVLWSFVPGKSIRITRVDMPKPRPTTAIAQLVASTCDWVLAAGVLFVLLPSAPRPATFIGVFLAAQLLAVGSHVPGGVGVFEGLMVLLLKPYVATAALVPALIVYRAVYYVLPLGAAVVILVADEVRLRRAQAARVGAFVGSIAEEATPRLLAVFTFIAGVVLLLSGATPAAAGRLARLDRIFPLGVIEASHFIGSIVGVALLVLSQGLSRRLDAAYLFAMAAICVGIAVSLLKGGDYEEALVLAGVLAMLWRARPAFDRRAALFDTRFSADWIAAIAGAMIAALWLGRFAFKHVEYSNELWWQFALHGEASRALRASVGAAIVLLLFAAARLLHPAPHEAEPPTEADLETASAIISRQSSTMPNLVFLRDKALLFDAERIAFVMYAVRGRTWVALGDPVGPAELKGDMISAFLERADDFAGVPVFYEIAKDDLHCYADRGLTFVKLGEEARVDLASFSLEGGHFRKMRQAVRRMTDAGATFRVVPPREVPAIMDQLRGVSNDWLAQRTGAEKSFSLGSFKDDYLSRFPIAVIEQAGRIVAFANLWTTDDHVEISVDLMRFHQRAPRDVMEALFAQLMTWAKAQQYRWFVLGMAPLYGFEDSPVAPLWNRLGAFLYEHGEAIYNFQGLRAFKDKFNPVWQPRYLAYPGGLRLPLILADVSALIAGGYRKIFLK
jgi:phosphatidylglycerol lysyltransferase